MSGRTIAIGDIHGCTAALDALLAAIEPQRDDRLIALGDYIDRGPDSRGTLDRLLELQQQCQLIPLLGNHDQMLLWIYDGRMELMSDWRLFGGEETLASYGGLKAAIPTAHLDFLRQCRLFYETDTHFFLHGNYWASVPLDRQEPDTVLWDSLKRRLPGPHCSGKIAIVGHSSQKGGEILDLGYLQCIDTYCYGTGWLTALDVDGGRIWQADKLGRLRPS